MSINITERESRKGDKIFYSLEWGKEPGQRVATGIFTYTKPKDNLQKNHNKESIATLELKRSKLILERQSIGTGYIPQHKILTNFLDYYEQFVKDNRTTTSRHLQCSFDQFKKFLKKDFVSPIDITEQVCRNFRSYLLEKYNGETPANYFSEFKELLKNAKKSGYFVENPAVDVSSKKNPSSKKEVIEVTEYLKLLKTPCLNREVGRAFVFCMYAALRWCDVKVLAWEMINNDVIILTQQKTMVEVKIPLHPVAKMILGQKGTGLIFKLPTADGANKILRTWTKAAGIEKHITWHCARLSFSVLLQDEGVNTATVAGMMGHTSTRQVQEVYQRYRVHIGEKAILKLPSAEF